MCNTGNGYSYAESNGSNGDGEVYSEGEHVTLIRGGDAANVGDVQEGEDCEDARDVQDNEDCEDAGVLQDDEDILALDTFAAEFGEFTNQVPSSSSDSEVEEENGYGMRPKKRRIGAQNGDLRNDIGAKFAREMNKFIGSDAIKEAFWNFFLDNCQQAAHILNTNKEKRTTYRTLKKDMLQETPRVSLSIECENEEDNLEDVLEIPVKNNRTILTESAYVKVSEKCINNFSDLTNKLLFIYSQKI